MADGEAVVEHSGNGVAPAPLPLTMDIDETIRQLEAEKFRIEGRLSILKEMRAAGGSRWTPLPGEQKK